ncbi:MAG: tyrosine recombinase XerC [Candidatus Dormibacteria bacterium]
MLPTLANDQADPVDGQLAHEHQPAPMAAWVAVGFLAGYGPSTRTAYLGDLRDFGSWCASRGLDIMAVDRAALGIYSRHLEEERGFAPATVGRRLSAVSGFYRYAADEGLLAVSPADRLRRPKVGDDTPALGLSRRDAMRLLRASEARDEVTGALTCLLLLNGLRVSEACSADIEDLGWDAGRRILRIRRKGGRHASVPLSVPAAAAVDSASVNRSVGPLLRNASGRRLSRQEAHRIIARLGRATGLAARVYPHLLRHTWVTAALDAGAPLQDVQDAAGHRDPKTTRRYDRARGLLEHHPTYLVAEYLT